MPDSLTPEQRSLRGRMGAYRRWAGADPVAGTEAARAAGPGSDAYWERKVDPDGALPDAERTRRAVAAKRAHFAKLALASSRARSRRAAS